MAVLTGSFTGSDTDLKQGLGLVELTVVTRWLDHDGGLSGLLDASDGWALTLTLTLALLFPPVLRLCVHTELALRGRIMVWFWFCLLGIFALPTLELEMELELMLELELEMLGPLCGNKAADLTGALREQCSGRERWWWLFFCESETDSLLVSVLRVVDRVVLRVTGVNCDVW